MRSATDGTAAARGVPALSLGNASLGAADPAPEAGERVSVAPLQLGKVETVMAGNEGDGKKGARPTSARPMSARRRSNSSMKTIPENSPLIRLGG